MGAVEKFEGDNREGILEKAKEAFEKSFPWFNPEAYPSCDEKEEEEQLLLFKMEGASEEEDP